MRLRGECITGSPAGRPADRPCARVRRALRSSARARRPRLSPFIFQLPATSGRRPCDMAAPFCDPLKRLANRPGCARAPMLRLRAPSLLFAPWVPAVRPAGFVHHSRTYMLRGIARPPAIGWGESHGGRAGPDRHQFRDLGHRRHFPGLRPLDGRQNRLHRDHRRPVPPDLQRPAAAARRRLGRPVTPDQARAAGARPAVRRPLRRSGARRARAGDAAWPLRSRDRAADHCRSGFKGADRPVRPRRFEAIFRNAGYNEPRFATEQSKLTLRREIADTVSGDLIRRRRFEQALNRYENEQRAIDYVTLDRCRRATSRRRRPT